MGRIWICPNSCLGAVGMEQPILWSLGDLPNHPSRHGYPSTETRSMTSFPRGMAPITLVQQHHAARHSYNLQLHGLPIHIDGPDLKVHPNGGDVALGVCVVLKHTKQWERRKASMQVCAHLVNFYRKAQQKTRLPDTRVSNQKKLEQVITRKIN